jgi:hypothetical protein
MGRPPGPYSGHGPADRKHKSPILGWTDVVQPRPGGRSRRSQLNRGGRASRHLQPCHFAPVPCGRLDGIASRRERTPQGLIGHVRVALGGRLALVPECSPNVRERDRRSEHPMPKRGADHEYAPPRARPPPAVSPTPGPCCSARSPGCSGGRHPGGGRTVPRAEWPPGRLLAVRNGDKPADQTAVGPPIYVSISMTEPIDVAMLV